MSNWSKLIIIGLCLVIFGISSPTVFAQTAKPNVLVILLDDLDEASLNQLLTAGKLPNIQQLIINKSLHFKNSFVSESICCPSRATLLTGKYSHNSGTYNVTGSESGLQGLVNSGVATTTGGAITNVDWLPTWLKASNTYYTGHIGKFMNTNSYGNNIKPGFDYWRLVYGYDARPGMYQVFKDNSTSPILPDVYEIKYLADRTNEFIDIFKNQSGKANFFLELTPTTPHINIPSWGEISTGQLSPGLASSPVVAYNTFDPPDSTVSQRRQIIVDNGSGDTGVWHEDLVNGTWTAWALDGGGSVLFANTDSTPIVSFSATVFPDTGVIRQHLVRGTRASGYNMYFRDMTTPPTAWALSGTIAALAPNTGNLPVIAFNIDSLTWPPVPGGDLVQYLLRGDPTNGYQLYTRGRVGGVWSTNWEKEEDVWDLGTGNFPIESFDVRNTGQGRLQLQIVREKTADNRVVYFQDVRSFYEPIPHVLGTTTDESLNADTLPFVYGHEADQLSLSAPAVVTNNPAYPQLMWGGRVYADGNWTTPTAGQTFASADYPNGQLPAGSLRNDGTDGISPKTGFDLPGLNKPNFNNCASNTPWICSHWPDVNSAVVGNRTQLTYLRRSHLDRQEAMLSVDVMVKKIVDHLQQTNLLQNTMIILTSDNGYFQGEHRLGNKMFAYDESQRVPLYIRPANTPITAETINNNTVVNIDLAPTILDYAGLWSTTYFPKVDGRSLRPILNTRSALYSPWRAWFYIDYHFPRGNVDFVGWEWAWGVPDFRGLRTGVEATAFEGKHQLYTKYTNDPLQTGEPIQYELYDTPIDPYQISNKSTNPAYAYKLPFYETVIAALGNCDGNRCRAVDAPVIGDVNVDFVVDTQDLKTVLQNYLSTSPLPNVTFDGKINALDAGDILNYL